MPALNLECPLNGLSFGQISFGVTQWLFKNNYSVNLFPIANSADLSAYDKAPEGYENWIRQAINNAPAKFNKKNPSLKIWHIHNGGHLGLAGCKQNLLTFHELDSLTETEVNILNQQEKVFVTSNYSKQVFENHGVEVPVIYAPMGFDATHFHPVKKKEFSGNVTTVSVFGKMEQRKHTFRVIKTLVEKFGGNSAYRVNLHTNNSFFKQEEMLSIYNALFNNQKPWNFTVFGFLPTNSHMNEAFNVCDIVVDMSGGESISLPSMCCVALGKHAVIHNCTSMKDWANSENAVLVQPSEKIPVYDGKFFAQGLPFNQGNIFSWKDEDFRLALDAAIDRFKKNPVNEAGFELQNRYSFDHGMSVIMEAII